MRKIEQKNQLMKNFPKLIKKYERKTKIFIVKGVCLILDLSFYLACFIAFFARRL